MQGSKTGRIGLPAVLAALLWLGGCASVPREAGFDEVQQTVADRTGHAVHWNQGTEADAAVAERVRAMLRQDELAVEEAVQIALLNNRDLQATYEDLMVAQADLVAAGLLRNPIFEAEIRFLESGGGETFEFGVVQEFLGIFQIPLRKKIASARFEAAKLRVAGAVLDLAAEVREAYYRLVAAKQTLEMRQTVVKATDAAYELARRLHEAGNIPDLALHQEQAQLESSKLALAAAEYDVIAQRESLNALMGLWGEAAAQWNAPGRLPEPPAVAESIEALESQVMASNLELAALRQRIEASGRVLGLERTLGLFPDAEAGAIGEREADGEWAIGPVFALPIPLFNQGQPQVAAAQAELRRSHAEYYATAVKLRAAARAAQSRLENVRGRVVYYQDVLLPLREQITQETLLQYNAMQIGAFQLLDARRQQIQTAAEFIEALREYWAARATLDTLRSGGPAQVGITGSERSGSATHVIGTSDGDH